MNFEALQTTLSTLATRIKPPLLRTAYLLALIWSVAFTLHGWANGPNYFSLRIVTVENARVWYLQREKGAQEIWTIDYSRLRLSDGAPVKDEIRLIWPDVPARIRGNAPQDLIGTDVLLRVPVAADEATAKFAFNRQVRQGALVLSLLLLFRWHVRRHVSAGRDPFEKRAYAQLALMVAAIGWLWIFGVPQGTD